MNNLNFKLKLIILVLISIENNIKLLWIYIDNIGHRDMKDT